MKENKAGTSVVSRYDYTVNAIGQRTNVAQTGTAFGSVRDIAWGYNAKGEVTKADSTIPGLDRAYVFDMIGNRLKSADSLTLPAANNYTPNALNQYSSITNPQSAILNPLHDADGNMTSGPLPANVNANSTLVWDGENRLIQAQVNGGATVNFTYDAQSRRIAETIGTTTKITIYDGWNPIAEYSTTYALTKTYIWGVDLSGSMQGAGGVGGLLAVTDSTGTYFPTFDGNGNVSEYLDSTGAIAAHYEYDPFGKTTVATGPKANDFAHRFSTKPLDLTTGLYYYGYRFYDPVTGRWPSRDPIGEQEGMNLYGFVGNNGISLHDYLGLFRDNQTINDDNLDSHVWHHTKHRIYTWIDCCECDILSIDKALSKALVSFKYFNDGVVGAKVSYTPNSSATKPGSSLAEFKATGPTGLLNDIPNSDKAGVTLFENAPNQKWDQWAVTNTWHPLIGMRRWGHTVSDCYNFYLQDSKLSYIEIWTEAYETENNLMNIPPGGNIFRNQADLMWRQYLTTTLNQVLASHCPSATATVSQAEQVIDETTQNIKHPWLENQVYSN